MSTSRGWSRGIAACGGHAKAYSDFRKLLDNKDIQAVVISTPDHWHALLTIMACAAGKDVYVEKPLTLFVREGRWMIDGRTALPARRAGRHAAALRPALSERPANCPCGLFRQGGQRAHGRLSQRHAGLRRPARLPRRRTISITTCGSDPPRSGPTIRTAALYHFRWFWDYSGGQMTNLGAHEIDIVQWSMEVKGPPAVSSSGGRFALQDNGETPDTQDALFEYPGFTAMFSIREASAGTPRRHGLEFFGTKGSWVSRLGIRSDSRHEDRSIQCHPRIYRGHPTGGPTRSSVQPEPWIQPYKMEGSSKEQFDLHARNFLDCVKSRERPIADVEQGHQTAAACHLANISLRSAARSAGIRNPRRSSAIRQTSANGSYGPIANRGMTCCGVFAYESQRVSASPPRRPGPPSAFPVNRWASPSHR